jgi:hypothetical protein
VEWLTAPRRHAGLADLGRGKVPARLDARRRRHGRRVLRAATFALGREPGEEYLPSASPLETFALAGKPERRSLLDGPRLCPELRAREGAARSIDAVLARATSMHPGARPPAARAFAAEVLSALRADSRRIKPSEQRLVSVEQSAAGRIWSRSQRRGGKWRCAWEDESWTAPMVSIYADLGMVLGVTADGGMVEGRMGMAG